MSSEIVLPETKPETEWIGDRAVQKVSPTYSHARLQSLFAIALTAWGEEGRGRVGTEWRFRVTPPGVATRPLVPDVAYVAYVALAADAEPDAFEVPQIAPTVAVEILSPDDRPADVAEKTRTYLAAGSSLVVVVDPHDQIVDLFDASGMRRLGRGETLAHDALPGFALDLTALFDRARR